MRVGYVGRLDAHKGVTVLLDAVSKVPGIELLIVGDGPEREQVERAVGELGISDRVRPPRLRRP